MLDFQALRQQMNDFSAYQLQFQLESESGLKEAVAIFKALIEQATPWHAVEDESGHGKLMAIPIDDKPARFYSASDRPPEVTVVATDGSQIYPDRHREPLWYLINISKIVFHYGTMDSPLLATEPTLFFRGQALDGLDEERIEITGRDVISAVRDELELAALAKASCLARHADRPLVALADGTLIRWMLSRIKDDALEKKLLKRYVDVLLTFRNERIPICSYISMPGNKEFVRLLMHQVYPEHEQREKQIKEINDRLFFEQVLPPGSRSAIFKAQSKILNAYAPDVKVCFFYIHIRSEASSNEIARVEIPTWMTRDNAWIDLIHATVVSEAQKGRGYPMILSEAHEHAVIRGQERTLFYEMIEQLSVDQGRPVALSMKQQSKDRPIL